MPGVDRFGVDGPLYRSFDLRLAKSFVLGTAGNLELIVEGFNLFNTTNYDVSSIDGARVPLRPDDRQPGGGGREEHELRQAERDAAVPRDPGRREVRLLGSTSPRTRPAGGFSARRTSRPAACGAKTAAFGPAEGEVPS